MLKRYRFYHKNTYVRVFWKVPDSSGLILELYYNFAATKPVQIPVTGKNSTPSAKSVLTSALPHSLVAQKKRGTSSPLLPTTT